MERALKSRCFFAGVFLGGLVVAMMVAVPARWISRKNLGAARGWLWNPSLPRTSTLPGDCRRRPRDAIASRRRSLSDPLSASSASPAPSRSVLLAWIAASSPLPRLESKSSTSRADAFKVRSRQDQRRVTQPVRGIRLAEQNAYRLDALVPGTLEHAVYHAAPCVLCDELHLDPVLAEADVRECMGCGSKSTSNCRHSSGGEFRAWSARTPRSRRTAAENLLVSSDGRLHRAGLRTAPDP